MECVCRPSENADSAQVLQWAERIRQSVRTPHREGRDTVAPVKDATGTHKTIVSPQFFLLETPMCPGVLQ